MATVYLGLGSNLGDRQLYIRSAIHLLNKNRVAVKNISSMIETDPEGGPPQGKFLNTVVKARTSLSPRDLLILAKSIETFLGRKPSVSNGPRPIDIDILLYDQISLSSPQLVIPHPRMRERAFVLKPLQEIAPRLVSQLFQN